MNFQGPPITTPVFNDKGAMAEVWVRWYQRLREMLGGATGIIPVTSGGTGIAAGVSGGVLAFTALTTLASSALLENNQIMLGGGAGATPKTGIGLGTTTQVLHGNAVGAPTWGAVALAADVTGTLPLTNGGLGFNSAAAGDVVYASAINTLGKLAIGGSGNWLGSTGAVPGWNAPAALTKVDDTNVTATLGGAATTALLNAASITLGWTGQLSTGRGGSGQNWSASSGIPLLTAGTASLLNSTGSGNVVRDTSPTITGISADTVTLNQSGTTGGLIRLQAAGTQFALLSTTQSWSGDGNTDLAIGAAAGKSIKLFANASVTAGLIVSATKAQFSAVGTTASAANAYLDNADSNSLLRSTSSIRYKTGIELIEPDDARDIVMKLAANAMTYTSMAPADDITKRFYGHTAEMVHNIDRRLVHYSRGIPDGVQYERMAVLHNVMLSDHELRLRKLEMANGH